MAWVRLRSLVGFLPGREQEYTEEAAKVALEEGLAEPIDAPARVIAPQPKAEPEKSASAPAGVISEKKRGRPKIKAR